MHMSIIKILLADDHTIFQHGLEKSLISDKAFTVIAKANSGKSAIALAEKYTPDLVIIDVSMPDINGMEATRQILLNNSNIKILALTMHSERIYVLGMLHAGASGYLLKSCSFNELLTAIHRVLSGKLILCPEIKHLLTETEFAASARRKLSVPSLISQREREVLQLIAEGNTNKSISEKLNISIKTVDVHRNNLKKKLDIHSIAGLTKFAINEGLTSLSL